MRSMVEGAIRNGPLRRLRCHLPRSLGRIRAPSYLKLSEPGSAISWDCATSCVSVVLMVLST
jgi:hypothetical protein